MHIFLPVLAAFVKSLREVDPQRDCRHPILQKSQYIYWKRFPSDVAIEIFVSKAHPPISLEVALVNRQLASDSKVIMYNGTFTIRIELDKVSFQDIDMTKVINRQRLYEKVCSKLRRIPLQLVRHLEIQLIRFPFNNAYTESTLLQRMRGPLSIVCYWLRSRQDVKGALQKLDRLTIRLVDAHTDSCTWRAAIEQPKESRIRINKADEKTRYRLGYLLEVLELLWGIKQVDFDFGKYTPASKTGKLAKELVGVMTREKPKWVLPSSLRPSALGGIEPLRASDRKDKTLFHAYNKGIFR